MKNKKRKDKFNFASNGSNNNNNNMKKPSGNNGNYYKNNNNNNKHKNNNKAYYSNKGNNNNKNKNNNHNNVNKNTNNFNNNSNNNYNDYKNTSVSTNNANGNTSNNNFVENNKNLNNGYNNQFVKNEVIEEEIEQLELDDEEDLVEEIKNNAREEVSNDIDDDFLDVASSIMNTNENRFENNHYNDNSQNNVFEKDEDVFFENTAGLNVKTDNVQNDFNDWFNNNIEKDNSLDTSIDNNDNVSSYENELRESLNNFENGYTSNDEDNTNNSNDIEVSSESSNTINEEIDNKVENDINSIDNNSINYNREEVPIIDNYNNEIGSKNYYEDNGIAEDIYGENKHENNSPEEIEEYNVDVPEPVVHEQKEVVTTNDDSSNVVRKSKVHFNFQMRVAILLTCILILLGSSAFLILKSVATQEEKKVKYEETTLVDYSACLSTNDPYKTKCLDSNQKYNSSNIKNVKATFTYKVEFDEEVDYSFAYHVVLVNRIYDRFDSKNIVYENEDVIVDKTIEDINDKSGKFDIDVDIDYKTYNDFVINYIKKYSSNSEASLDALLYITEGEETRKVATINIPLNKTDFKITSTLVSNEKHNANIIIDEWTDKDTRSIIIGIAFVLVAIVLMIRFTKLVMSTITKKSAYEVKLHEILNEYDRMIVVARDGYESDTVMKVVKVSSFEELLDARNILNKPIIYSKVNNVKSEFIVEDDDKIYKYVMKEADIH